MDPQQLIFQAMQLHEDGDIEQANDIYEALLSHNNEHPELLFLSSSTSWMLGRPQAAYARLKKAIHIEADERYHSLLGNVCQSLGKYEEAIHQYTIAIEKGLEEADTYSNMGLALFEVGSIQEAKEAHQKAILLDETHMGAYYNLALLHLREQEYDIAQQYFLEAHNIEPSDVEVLNNLGNTFLHQGNIIEARRYYAQALASDQTYPDALYNMAISYEATHELAEAKYRLQALLERHPQNIRAMRKLADIMIAENDFYSAEQILQMATQIDPNHAESWSRLADTLLQQDQYGEALITIEKALEIHETAHSWIQLGIVQRELAMRKELAIATEDIAHSFRKALELEPTSGKAQYILDMIEGNTPDKAPIDYVENLFDFYAPKFEEHLVDVLHYQTPQKLADFLWEHTPKISNTNILDLGCGTGLMGPILKDNCAQIVGVDISPLMLAQAKEKNTYSALHKEDIFSFLSSHTHTYSFDLIVAADVLVYIGDLAPLFTLLMGVMKPQARFVFSVEECDEGFHLGQEARFLHSLSYIEASLPASLTLVSTKREALRKNSNLWVDGLLVMLQYNP